MEDEFNTYLIKAHLQGFQTIEDVSVEFLPGLNIIIGQNSSGKTNFVQFLEKALRLNYKGIFSFNSELTYKHENKNVVLQATRKFEFEEGKERELGGNDGVVYSLFDEGDKREFDHIGKLLNNSPFGFGGILIRHGVPSDVPVLNFSWNIILSPVDDLFDFGLAITYPRFFRSAIIALRNSITCKSRSGNLVRDTIEKSVKEAFGTALDQLNNYFSRSGIIDGVRLSDFEIIYDSYLNKYHLSNLSFLFRSRGSWLPYSALSDGVKRMLYVIMEFLWLPLRVNVNTGLITQGEDTKNVVYLLEEPELGIHPHLLNKLLSFVKEQSEQKQIIITTHSPQVLDILGPDDLDRIILCEFDNEKGTQLRHMTEEEKAHAQSYMKEMYLSDFWRFTDFNEK